MFSSAYHRCRWVTAESRIHMIEAQPHSSSTPRVAAFDRWIRGRFIDLNTELEDIYAEQENR